MNYYLHILIYLCIYIIEAISLNIAIGYCGTLTLAHASYWALGAYIYALATMMFHCSFSVAIFFSFTICAIFSLIVSLPSLRLKGDFFIMVTLAVQSLVYSLLYNWSNPKSEWGTWRNITNGPAGISGIPKPIIGDIKYDTIGSVAFLSIVLTIACIVLSWWLLSSPWSRPWGRLLKSIRDDELAAIGLGKNIHFEKIRAFALSCGLVGIAGAIYAFYTGYIEPSATSLDNSILMLSMVIVGGVGNLRGPLVGATVLLIIPEILRAMHIPDSIAADLRLMAYGLLLIIMMHVRPQGIAGEYRIE
jgi:branched-chain amino acid transport system permease protein